jgi:FkbM family methyltransferase
MVDVLGYRVHIIDSASFLSMYRLIFVTQVYWFSAHSSNPTILDCGANIGLSVIFFKRLYPESNVIAFEPDPAICTVLRENIAKNRLEHVEVVESAVWTQRGSLNFVPDHADGGKIIRENSEITSRVTSVRLRDYLVTPIDLLKMDIEGAEIDVLADCADSLRQVRSIILEYHSYASQAQRLDELLKLLREEGFRYYFNPEQPWLNPFSPITVDYGIDQLFLIYAVREDALRYHRISG